MDLCLNPWGSVQYRWHVMKSIRAAIDQNEGGLEKFSQGGDWHDLCLWLFVSKKQTFLRNVILATAVAKPHTGSLV